MTLESPNAARVTGGIRRRDSGYQHCTSGGSRSTAADQPRAHSLLSLRPSATPMHRDGPVLEAILDVLERLDAPLEEPDWAALAAEHGEDAVLYNTALLRDMGYVRVEDTSTNEAATSIDVPDSLDALGAGRLTWEGHDLLNQFRSDKHGPEITF